MWQGTGGIENQILKMAIVYNECNCPASNYFADSPPSDMTITVNGADQTQTLAYQYSDIEFTFEMNCGKYDVTLAPSKTFLTVSASGINLDPYASPFIDTLTLSGATVADIGVHNFQMTVSQDVNVSGQGFTSPYRGAIPSITYDFTVTVDPCAIQSYIASVTVADVSMVWSDAPLTSPSYSFSQTPQCGYAESVQIGALPSFLEHDATTTRFTAMPSDSS